MTKTRRAAEASSKILRSGVNAVRTVTSHATARATALRPIAAAVLMLMLLALAVSSLGRFQLWMTGAGLFLVALSIASAVQEFKLPQTAHSYQDYLAKDMAACSSGQGTLPHVTPVKSAEQETAAEAAASSMALDMSMAFPTTLPKAGRRQSEDSIGALESAVAEAAPRRNSSAETASKLDVLHCGTVIDIQGSHGFIIPHDLCVDAKSAKAARSNVNSRPTKQHKMPLVIPFNLNDEQGTIAVGKTVEFAFSESNESAATLCALNVTPVPSDDGIMKSRSALQTCKQARQVSFARAMEELTMISPRNVPVKHHVDLIKYAEQLDDHDAPFDQCI